MDAIIVDADHTLYDPRSAAAYDAQIAFLADETGLDGERLRERLTEEIDRIADSADPEHRRRTNVLKRVIRDLGVDAGDAVVDESVRVLYDTVTENMTYADGLDAMLDRLHEQYRLAVASDEFRRWLLVKLREVVDDPEELFDAIVTPEDTGVMKPSTRYVEAALGELGVEAEESVVVGDSWERDLAPAADLGAVTVLVGTAEGAPDHTIETITELEALLEDI